MKINVSSVARIQSARAYSQQELASASRPVVGKSGVVDVADSVTGSALAEAAKSALGITPPAGFVKAVIVKNDVELDGSKTLAMLGLKEGSSVQVRFYVQIV
jgi:hypothetical protein